VHPHGKGVRDTLHWGNFAGTSTLLVRRGGDNLTWAVLFNGHSGSRYGPAGLIYPLVEAAAQAVMEWP